MDAAVAWENLSNAITEMQKPEGDYQLKLDTVLAGVHLLFEHPAEEILKHAERSSLPTRAVVSWLVYEGSRLPGVDPTAVAALRALYEATCAPGEGIIPPPPPGSKVLVC